MIILDFKNEEIMSIYVYKQNRIHQCKISKLLKIMLKSIKQEEMNIVQYVFVI